MRNAMGETYVNLRLHGSRGSLDVQALADTGATFTKIPRKEAQKIGIEPRYKTQVQLSTGLVISRSIGYADIDIEGVRRLVPVAIGEDGEPAILGCTALEILEFKVNPITRKLEKSIPIEY
jgi:predicted aspartyl protease